MTKTDGAQPLAEPAERMANRSPPAEPAAAPTQDGEQPPCPAQADDRADRLHDKTTISAKTHAPANTKATSARTQAPAKS